MEGPSGNMRSRGCCKNRKSWCRQSHQRAAAQKAPPHATARSVADAQPSRNHLEPKLLTYGDIHVYTHTYIYTPYHAIFCSLGFTLVTHPRLHGTGNAKSCDRHETTSQCIQCDAFCSAGGPTGGKELRENSKELSSLLSTRLLKASSGGRTSPCTEHDKPKAPIDTDGASHAKPWWEKMLLGSPSLSLSLSIYIQIYIYIYMY